MKRYMLAPRLRLEMVRDAGARYVRRPIRAAGDVYRFLRDDVELWERERFLVLALDGRHRTIGLDEVSVGSLSASLVHPREVFKALILANAAAFVLAHNHPSGDASPSKEDREITARLKEAADLMGISLLDHIILTAEGFHSFREAGDLAGRRHDE